MTITTISIIFVVKKTTIFSVYHIMHDDNVHICMKTSFEYHSLTMTYVKKLVGSKTERELRPES